MTEHLPECYRHGRQDVTDDDPCTCGLGPGQQFVRLDAGELDLGLESVCGYCGCEEAAHGAEPEEVDVGGLVFENDCTGCGECPGFEEEP